MNLPRKTTILIVILAVVTALLIFLAVTSDTTQQMLITDEPSQTVPTETVVQPYATLGFSVPQLDLVNSQTATQSVDIVLDSAGKGVFSAQIELQYDANALFNMSLQVPTQNSFFGPNVTTLIPPEINPSQGRISYAVALSPTEKEKIGRGVIATLTFTANRFNTLPKTEISFLQKSAVTTISGSSSILKSSTSLPIILAAPISSPSAQ